MTENRRHLRIGRGDAELQRGVERPVRIDEILTAERDEIGLARPQNLFGLVCMDYHADRHRLHVRTVAYRLRILHLITVTDGIGDWRRIEHAAGAAIDHVDAVLAERARERDAV